MKELAIAANMIALARNRKGANKRSAMLRMIMPFLSRDTGDKLASAIDKRDSAHFAKEWDKVKKEITARLSIQHKKNADKHLHHGKHKATGADVHTFARDDATSISVQTWGAPERIRLNINGNAIFDGTAPEENNEPLRGEGVDKPVDPIGQGNGRVAGSMATIQVETENTGQTYVVSDPQIVEMIKLVCERLLMDADPCPLPEKPVEYNSNIPFDYNADILELHDRLVSCRSL
jgi:hypothetical protein